MTAPLDIQDIMDRISILASYAHGLEMAIGGAPIPTEAKCALREIAITHAYRLDELKEELHEQLINAESGSAKE